MEVVELLSLVVDMQGVSSGMVGHSVTPFSMQLSSFFFDNFDRLCFRRYKSSLILE